MIHSDSFFYRSLPLFLLILGGLLSGCEEEFTPPDVETSPQIVVEGYIEASGENSAPPYVILTRTLPFFRNLSSDEFADFFVHDAVVTVDDGDQQAVLTEICLADLTPEQQVLAEAFLGTNIDAVSPNFCVYLDVFSGMRGEVGKTYALSVSTPAGDELTATTTIPEHVALDSVYFAMPPGEPTRPELRQLQAILSDPAGPNFYRYFVQVNSGGFRRDDFSVLDDRFFDGGSFVLPLNQPLPDSADFDLSTFGLFTQGDTIELKWINFEKEVFDFWNTIEFAAANQGPFSNYTIIDTNVEGGLGIWAGQSASFYRRVVE